MKFAMRIAVLVALLLAISPGLIYGQAGSGPVAGLTIPVLPTLPVNLRVTTTQFFWDYDFTQPNSRACSTTVTTVCVTGFTTQTVNTTTNAIVAGRFAVSLPATINTTGPTIGV